MHRARHNESGNIFAVVFGGVALVGVLGAAAMNVLAGPVRTITAVTQKNIAQTNLMTSARIIISASAAGTSGGDADSDGIIEPAPYKDAGTFPAPVGGGLLPDDLGLSRTDPWGTAYGYCVWDHGTVNSSTGRLTGDNTPGASSQFVLAVIAAGPDKVFSTTCEAFTSGPVAVVSAAGSDDVVLKYSYAEALALSGGLWTLNSADANQAELQDTSGAVNVSVNRSGGIVSAVGVNASTIDATAVIATTISAAASANDTLQIGGALRLDDSAGSATVCGAGQSGALRLNAAHDGLEICNGASFQAFATGGGGGALSALSDVTLTTPGAGQVLTFNGSEWVNGAAPVTSESDPRVGATDSGKWCRGDGAAVQCDQPAPFSGYEVLSQNFTATANVWYAVNCPSGKKALGGACNAANGRSYITSSQFACLVPSGPAGITVYVTCAVVD